MAIIRGHRESKGATAAELQPLQAQILEKLSNQTSDAINLYITLNLNKKNDNGEDKNGERIPYTLADYERDGPQPFVCDSCKYLEEGNYCTRVKGPYNDLVRGQDTCRLWEASPVLTGSKER